MSKVFLNELNAVVNDEWEKIKQGRFWELVLNSTVDADFYRKLMVEIYHYTKHNSINQAAAAYKTPSENTRLLGFVYRHAAEELGHENMIVRDLASIGLLDQQDLKKPPLAPTEALVGYLYYVSLNYGAIARLGYSFWAEDVYGHIDDVLNKIKKDLSLESKNMSFFVAHSHIDQKHSQEVRDAIVEHIQSHEDQMKVMQVAKTTLSLTGAMLDAVADSYFSLSKSIKQDDVEALGVLSSRGC